MLKSMTHFNKLKRIAHKYYQKGKWEKSLHTIFAASGFMYTLNTVQTDADLEELLSKIAMKILPKLPVAETIPKTVIYYDSFGNITRGLNYIYLEALLSLGYHVKYVTFEGNRNLFLSNAIDKMGLIDVFWIHGNSYQEQMTSLLTYVCSSHAENVFLCLKPDDVVAVGVFSYLPGCIKRYMINLTDHAFWLGRSISDCVINFREFGCQVCAQKRGFSDNSIAYIPYYPHEIITEFQGFSFKDNSLPLIFSGGALYKTESDDNKYYLLLESILNNHNVNFIYCGNGDDRKIRKIQAKYPGRFIYEAERYDFYEIMKRCTLYLSTYPYNGGLMTQYALLAGKIPITLSCPGIEPELTVNHFNSFWNFTTFETCLEEIDKLLKNKEYRHQKEQLLSAFLLTKDQFSLELNHLLISGESFRSYKHEEAIFDGFQRLPVEYYVGTKYCRLFFRRGGFHLFRYFPAKYLVGLCTVVTEKFKFWRNYR